jgi:hypothetical protein
MASTAPLAVDHEQVRTIALAVGVREAARQFGIQEDTVKKWSSREGWFAEKAEKEQLVQRAIEMKRISQGLSPIVPTAAEILKRTGPNTRAKLSIAVEKQAEHLAVMDPEELVVAAQTVTTVINGAAKLHSWAITVGGSVRLDVLASGAGDSAPVINI